jgi:glutamine amidotransferase
MCRLLGYLGTPALLHELIVAPDNALIRQATDAQMLAMLNLAGYGLAAWDENMAEPAMPFLFHSTQVAVLDNNLRSLARKLRVGALVAHLRGVAHDGSAVVNQQSCHPFAMAGSPLVLAHNGDLHHFSEMRFALFSHVKPAVAQRMTSMIDSAFLHALVLSQFEDPAGPFTCEQIHRAVEGALIVVRQVRGEHGIADSSSVNLLVSDGRSLVATRFTYDFGRFDQPRMQGAVDFLSQWYTYGDDYRFADGEWKMVGESGQSTLVASEPLTRDVSTWIEVPEYSALLVDRETGATRRRIRPIEV